MNQKYTIGYFDNNYYTENYNNLVTGMLEAAKKHNVQLICFGYQKPYYEGSILEQIVIALDHASQYQLDGLLCLGCSPAFLIADKFKDIFGDIPILSVGSCNQEGIPSVFFNGERYLDELLQHLIQEHCFKKIAYIASPTANSYNQQYIRIMQQNGLYNPDLYISEIELAGCEDQARGRKAVSLLLDDRMVEMDAIITLYNRDTEVVIEELKQRDIKVPDDIAVTSFDDGDLARYYSPSFTTIYYPWIEMGYISCEKLIEILEKGYCSPATEVLGKVVIRESCGCISNTVKNVEVGRIKINSKRLDELTATDIEIVANKINSHFYYLNINSKSLIDAFIKDFKNHTNLFFSEAIRFQLENITEPHTYSNIGELVSILRQNLLPYLSYDADAILWSGNLFQQAQICLWDQVHSIRVNAMNRKNKENYIQQEISQQLINNFNIDNLFDTLENNLHRLNIVGCSIIIFDAVFNSNGEEDVNRLDSCSLKFNYYNKQRYLLDGTVSVPAKDIIRNILCSRNNYVNPIYSYLLYSQNDLIGIVLHEAGLANRNIYQELTEHISVAIKGALILAQLDNSYKLLLTKAHREGIADVAITILHNIGNVLNSAFASLHILKDVIANSPINEMKKATQILENNLHDFKSFIHNDPKGKKLMKFYVKLTDSFINMQDHLKYHVSRLDEKICSITEIINAQQVYAGVKVNTEIVDIVNIIEDVLKLQFTSLDRQRIVISKEYRSFPRVIAQRAKVFHIIYSIIENAKEAMLLTPEQGRKLSVVVIQNETSKLISISDTGCGMEQYMLQKIFSHGFSTKKDSSGFGLYSCANYMMDIGGNIWAESEGLGKGSTIILKFI